MILSLTRVQLNILRRCAGRLRVWERDTQRQALLAELLVLCQLGLVIFDEAHGYELTHAGVDCLARLGV